MAVRYAILGLLHYRSMHGYQIKKHLETHFGHMWTINYGQIYPNLKQMQEEGLVLMEVSEPGIQGPNRKLYAITSNGRREFARWLSESPENRMLLRDPFLMRFVFFGFGDDERALDLIEEQIQIYEEQSKQRKDNYHRWSEKGLYVRLIAELGLNLNEMFLEWLKKARQELKQELANKKTVSAAD